jgi:murein DD-endopeptidase MepM/ murein hydrolase activator NlpD
MVKSKNLGDQSIYSDEKQQLYRNDMSFGNDIGNNAWDLDRSTPMGTLKDIIRKVNTPNSTTDLTIAKAMVLRVEDQIKSFYETVNQKMDSRATYQMARIMVLSDPRHYWLPEAKRSDDPAVGFYPLVKYVYGTGEAALKAGDIVDVQFNNPRAQFSSHMETGTIIGVEGHINNKYALEELQRCASILPASRNAGPDPCQEVFRLGSVDPTGAPAMSLPSGEVQLSPAPPVRNLFVTSPFDLNRLHPTEGRRRPHYGTDFRAPIGEVIFAAFDGIATVRTNKGGPTKGYGYYIFIKHTSYSKTQGQSPVPFFTLYAHLQDHNKYPVIKNGQQVKRGQPIAFSGGSGIGSGAHLHFEYVANSTTPFSAGEKKDPMTNFIGKTFYQSQE